ncbi:MAG TPA: hypothetical protein VEX38_06365, partial [Fimbriimonadaceae bacterium]|nr:hypothetical protein [Fimbriimonadaceae bacterium]
MAQQLTVTMEVLVRAANPELAHLWQVLYTRYPTLEWGTFARFGWRETGRGLVLTLVALDPPCEGHLDPSVGLTRFREPYILRTALAAEQHQLAVGVIHSHPRGCLTCPSDLDDDMDSYFADYFSGFASGRPYVSLIFAEEASITSGTGRIWW